MLDREQNPRPHGNNCSESGGEGAFKHNFSTVLVPDFVQTQSAFRKHPIHPCTSRTFLEAPAAIR
jgi:hypothetical protein